MSNAPNTHVTRPDIQGLRAIAVLSVVLYHANAAWMPGGFAGVDVFFVISGYLITGILLREMDGGVYSLTGFYERRVRRLFPALFTMLAVVLVVAAFTLSPDSYKELASTALATIFFVSNIAFNNLSGYFDQDAHFRPLLHTWSLAVEEQFYLLFPPLLFVLVKFARRRLRWILAAGAALSLALCIWELGRHASTAFYLAPFRGYELLIGAVIAGLPFPNAWAVWRNVLSVVGLLAIALALLFFNDTTPFPGMAALLPCMGAACVLFAGAGAESWGGRLISGAPFMFFGGLSYSLYLWHWPVLVLGESILLHAPSPWQTALFIAVAISLATLSWRYIEQPFQKRGRKTRVLVLGATAIAIGGAITLVIVKADGVPARFSPAALQMFAARNDYSAHRWTCHDFLDSDDRPYAQHCVLGATTTPRVAVWGDSHGVEIAEALAERLATAHQSLLQLTASGCPPSLDYARAVQPRCVEHNRRILTGLAADPRIVSVVIATNMLSYDRADWPRVLSGEAQAAGILAAHGKHIVFIEPIPRFDYDVPTALGVLRAYRAPLSAIQISRATFDAEVRADRLFVAREHNALAADVFDPEQYLCDADECDAYRAGVGALYFNRDHLSESGARMLMAHFPLSWLDARQS